MLKIRYYLGILVLAILVWGFIPGQKTVVKNAHPTKATLDCTSDVFKGQHRRHAKTSLATGASESFENVQIFLKTLINDSIMCLDKSINRSENNPRAASEQRNIHLKNAFIYAVKREPDNDYHLIIGDKDSVFFNIEISGLPEEDKTSFKTISKVRKQVEDHFGELCNSSYKIFNPPVAIEFEGSLFFDVDHKAGVVGPKGFKPKTAWEIHPVSNILFK